MKNYRTGNFQQAEQLCKRILKKKPNTFDAVHLLGVLNTKLQNYDSAIEYIQKALENAEYKKLDDGTWFAEINGFQGVWANGKTVEVCRKELAEVLEEWLLLKIKDGDKIPQLDDIQIRFREVVNI